MDFIKSLEEKYNIFLNEQQQKAVLNVDGAILLLAVPGGGKTTVIVSRCANMIINHRINPGSILTLTFSKASALDMKNRFLKVFGNELGSKIHFSTIHSFCFSVLKTYTNREGKTFPEIIEDVNAKISKAQLLKQLFLKYNSEYINDDKLEELSNLICFVKNMMLSEDSFKEYETQIKNFSNIFNSYEEYKRSNNLIDYDDMLCRTLELFEKDKLLLNIYRKKYTHVNIDESQDTSLLQHEIIKKLVALKNNIFMVGDEDQSIYSFRAAFPKALLDFKITYPNAEIYLMERNYRSTKNIVSAANSFIKQNRERYEKNMFTEKAEGIEVVAPLLKDSKDQCKHIVKSLKEDKLHSEIAILYRNNISAIPIIDALEKNNIPFYIREAKTQFFKHWVTNDILAFIKLSFDCSDVRAFEKLYYKMNAYISKAMLEFVINNIKEGQNLFDVLRMYPGLNERIERKIIKIKSLIDSIKILNPHNAIRIIEETLEYKKHLNRMCSESGYSLDNLMQIIGCLKNIAEGTSTVLEFINRLDILQAVMEAGKFNKGKNAVTLSTIHSSKGLEFEKVFMIDLIDGQFPSAASISEFEDENKSLMEEEVRLFYVGITRAINYLEVISFKTLEGNFVKPSRFIVSLLPKASVKKEEILCPVKVDFCEEIINPSFLINDLHINGKVIHNKFGLGTIKFISEKHDLLEIHFDKHGSKLFSIRTCMMGDFIKLVEDNSGGSSEDGSFKELDA
jgi:DNA helicase II / ATP-dependent DNA helicase PcrA